MAEAKQPAAEKGGFPALHLHQDGHPQREHQQGQRPEAERRKAGCADPPGDKREGKGMAGDHLLDV